MNNQRRLRLWRWPSTEWEWLIAGVLATLLLAVGIAVLQSGPGLDAQAVALQKRGVQTTAHITEVETFGRGAPWVTIQFTTLAGQVITAEHQKPGGTYVVGREVDVVYDPASAQRFAFGTRDEVDVPRPVWGFFGALSTAAGCWQLLRTITGFRLLRANHP